MIGYTYIKFNQFNLALVSTEKLSKKLYHCEKRSNRT